MSASDLDAIRTGPVEAPGPGLPFAAFQAAGFLWLVNRVVFHPRGYALVFHMTNGEVTGWSLDGDGEEVWTFGDEIHEDSMFAKVKELLGG